MLVNMNAVLLPAKKEKYAVGLFNAINLEMTNAIMDAAESLKARRRPEGGLCPARRR